MTRHAIVAGVGPGMGLALARRFAREGYDISMLARGGPALATYEASIREMGVGARGYSTDLSDLASVTAAFERIAADRGPADVLIYNASRWYESPTMALDPAMFAWDLALCATGALACAQHVYPAMKAAGSGTMLFTGGGLALFPQMGKGVAGLTAGKSAMRGLVLAMADELAADNIHAGTVTIAGTIAPGTAFDPDLIAEHFWQLHVQPRADWEVERVFRG